MTTAPALLFVYGTLRSDCGTAHALLGDAGFQWLGRASAQGRLYEIAGYPGLVFSADYQERVQGELYAVPGDAAAFAELDAYEGCSARQARPHEFSRREIEVQLADGALLNAWTYLYQFPIDDCERIMSGDYLSRNLPSTNLPSTDYRQD